EFVGADATHGPLARAAARLDELPEVQLRIGVRSPDKPAVERFTREIAPLILNGPPSVTGFAGGRPKPEEGVAYWPALLDKRRGHDFAQDRRPGQGVLDRPVAPRGGGPQVSDRVLVALEGGVLTATLNRPEKKNAIDTPMIDALLTLLERADLDGAVRVVAVRGSGGDFCAGMDLNELLASADKSVEENRRAALQFAEIFVRMRRLPKPIVAVVQGRALAGGCGLATACDLVLATESASFGYPEVQRGFVPAIVMTLLKRSAGEKVAFDLAATGRILGASEAAGLGLVSRVYEDSDFEDQVS